MRRFTFFLSMMLSLLSALTVSAKKEIYVEFVEKQEP